MSTEFRTNLNLLSSRHRRWVLVRTGLTLWACIWVGGFIVAGVAVWRADHSSAAVRNELARYQRLYAPIQVMARELRAMRERLVEVQSEEDAAGDLEDDRPALALLGIISEAARQCDERLQVRECRLERRSADAGGAQVLTIKGAALELLSVTKFHATLLDAGMFERVELKPTTSEEIGGQNGFVFHVECAY
jgi:hypothetical protein